MKKLIISKTMLFLFIILFISGFQHVFSMKNTLAGVTIVIAALMYLDNDLTVHPWRNFFSFLGLNLIQGIFAYISAANIWLAVPVNLVSMFIVGYFFTYSVRKPLYIAFGFQYLFLLTTPVTLMELPLRLTALASGAVIIILLQLLVNRNKLSKTGTKHIQTIVNQLTEKWKSIEANKDYSEMNRMIENSIKELRKIIYYRRFNRYYLSNEGRLNVKISACLEKVNILLDRFAEEEEHHTETMRALSDELANLNEYIKTGSPCPHSLQALRKLVQEKDSLYINDVIYSFSLLYEILDEYYQSDKKELDHINKEESIPPTYTTSYRHRIDLNKESARFSYAMRLGIIIALAAFISDYYVLENGRWILFTIFSITQPFSEHTRFRIPQRIIGTLLAVFLFITLFSIFTGTTSRTLIVLLFGYLNSYATTYRNIILTATVSALGSASLLSDPATVTIERILYILAGVLIGSFANRYLFPYSIKKDTAALVQMYKDTSRHLMDEVYAFLTHKKPKNTIHNLFVITSFIEDRILLHNETVELKDSQDFLNKQKKLNNSIYELYLRTKRNKIDDATVKLIMEDVDRIMHTRRQDLDKLAAKLKNHIHPDTKIEDRILINNIVHIFTDFKKIQSYKIEFVPKK